jgi:ribosomal protein S18 acetylase RimI-like enzyme
MTLLIRPAKASEMAVAARLLIAQLVEHGLPADLEGVQRGLELAMTREAAWLLIALRQQEPVGIFLANEIVSAEKSGLALWVEELYVVPSARRTGVARAMLEHVRVEAKKKGIVAIELEVVPTQEAAFALYRGMGFVDVDRRRMGWKI